MAGKALITGGAGFIGSHLAETLLDDDWDVWVLDDTAPHATLTLITCYPFTFVGSAPERFVVSATLEPPRTAARAQP